MLELRMYGLGFRPYLGCRRREFHMGLPYQLPRNSVSPFLESPAASSLSFAALSCAAAALLIPAMPETMTPCPKRGLENTQICLRPCSQVKDLGCRVRVIIIKILYRTTPRLLYDKSWVPYKMRAYQGKILCYSMVYIKL